MSPHCRVICMENTLTVDHFVIKCLLAWPAFAQGLILMNLKIINNLNSWKAPTWEGSKA